MNYLKCKKLIEAHNYRDVTLKSTLARTSEVFDFKRGSSQITIDGPNIRYLEHGTGIIYTKLDDMNLIAVLAYSLLPGNHKREIGSKDLVLKMKHLTENGATTAAEKSFVEVSMQVAYKYKLIRQNSDE